MRAAVVVDVAAGVDVAEEAAGDRGVEEVAAAFPAVVAAIHGHRAAEEGAIRGRQEAVEEAAIRGPRAAAAEVSRVRLAAAEALRGRPAETSRGLPEEMFRGPAAETSRVHLAGKLRGPRNCPPAEAAAYQPRRRSVQRAVIALAAWIAPVVATASRNFRQAIALRSSHRVPAVRIGPEPARRIVLRSFPRTDPARAQARASRIVRAALLGPAPARALATWEISSESPAVRRVALRSVAR